MTTLNFTVGAELWYVPNDHFRNDNARTVRIERVGRVWAYFRPVERGWQELRARIEDGRVDGGNYSSPGALWSSEDAWKTAIDLDKAWKRFLGDFNRSFQYGRRPSVALSHELIAQARELLGLPEVKS